MAVLDASGNVLDTGDVVVVTFLVAERQPGNIVVLTRELLGAGRSAAGVVPRVTPVRFGCHQADLQGGGPPPTVGQTASVKFRVVKVFPETNSVWLLRERMQTFIVNSEKDLRTTPVSFGCDGLQCLLTEPGPKTGEDHDEPLVPYPSTRVSEIPQDDL